TACTTVLSIIYCTKIEKRSFRSMGFVKEGWLLNYLKGFLIGTAMLFVCAAIAWALGALDFSFAKRIPVFYIIAFLFGFLIQGMSEEVLLRGYFMVSLANRCHVALAVTISSIAFSLLHLMNPGISLLALVNIGLFGGFMGVYVLRTDDLWGACAIHSAWNFVQGNILGIQVSGTGQLPTVAVMQPVAGMDLLSGGRFGLEAGLIVTIVTATAICFTLFLPRKKEKVGAQVP
ncbi:MAG: CPBP family intramembrane metalloprotease, partial [Oscillospiraceae bacterium]|nr:CPBP family intramembrane metalloprotease [Oscillospiraceae bacterium]